MAGEMGQPPPVTGQENIQHVGREKERIRASRVPCGAVMDRVTMRLNRAGERISSLPLPFEEGERGGYGVERGSMPRSTLLLRQLIESFSSAQTSAPTQ